MISIVLPAYNEERRIRACLDACFSKLPRVGTSWEIIVVDDGSTDDTWKILEYYGGVYAHFIPIRTEHRGKGHAVKTGMLLARGEYRLFLDVDLSTPLTEIASALDLIGQYEIVIGSREVQREKVASTWFRRFMGRVFHVLVSDLVPPGIRDTQCGFKMFRDYVAEDLFSTQKINGMAFDVELLYLAGVKQYSICEMPVTWTHDPDSRVRLSTPLTMLLDAWSLPMLHRDVSMSRQTS